MELDPWGPIVGVLFEDQSSDYILRALQRAGVPIVVDLTEEEASTHITRKRAYERRLAQVHAELSPQVRRRVAQNLAVELSKSDGGLDRLNLALGRIDWCFKKSELKPLQGDENQPSATSYHTEVSFTRSRPKDEELLLAEVEEIKAIMPARGTLRHQTQENHNWFGRASAAIDKWNPSKSASVKEYLDLFFSNGHARETAHGLTKFLILLDQAQADLRARILPLQPSSNIPATSAQQNALILLSVIYEHTYDNGSVIEDITQIDMPLTDEQAKAAFHYLKHKSLIQTFPIEYAARINARGASFLDRLFQTSSDSQSDERESFPLPPPSKSPSKALPRKVFIVHGHDTGARETVARFLEKLSFQAIILQEQANQGQTVIEKIESHGDVGFAIVLLTPDDVGGKEGGTHRPRPRQNVVAEFGYFIGRLGRARVCALATTDTMELPTDFAGVVWQLLDAGGGWKNALCRELQAAGFKIDGSKAILT